MTATPLAQSSGVGAGEVQAVTAENTAATTSPERSLLMVSSCGSLLSSGVDQFHGVGGLAASTGDDRALTDDECQSISEHGCQARRHATKGTSWTRTGAPVAGGPAIRACPVLVRQASVGR